MLFLHILRISWNPKLLPTEAQSIVGYVLPTQNYNIITRLHKHHKHKYNISHKSQTYTQHIQQQSHKYMPM